MRRQPVNRIETYVNIVRERIRVCRITFVSGSIGSVDRSVAGAEVQLLLLTDRSGAPLFYADGNGEMDRMN